jgi:hypothetical protein
MKITFQYLLLVVLSSTILFSQEVTKNDKTAANDNAVNKIGSTQAVEGDVIFSDGTNNLLRITDEGTIGAIQFQNGVPSDVSNKLYNDDGVLHFNGTSLGSGGAVELNDLSDVTVKNNGYYIGSGSGVSSNNTGFLNVGIGLFSLNKNASGKTNIAIGSSSLLNNTTGDENTAIGSSAGLNSIGSGNVFLGYNSGYNETSNNKLYIENSDSDTPLIWGDFTDGSEQVKINGDFHVTGSITVDGSSPGSDELNDLTDAIYDGKSLFLGDGAGTNDDGNNSNVGFGKDALRQNTIGTDNTAIGYQTLYSNTAGYNLTANGSQALYSNTTGYNNTAFGNESLRENTTGSGNTAHGHLSLNRNTSGGENTATGMQSLFYNTSGNENTANGRNALFNNTEGNFNTAIGFSSLRYNATGNYNTAVGYQAGPYGLSNNLENTTAIGNGATVFSDNEIRIGNSAITSIGGYAAWSNLSDGRYKSNLKEDIEGINFIIGLRPVSYNFDIEAVADKLGENTSINENGNMVNNLRSVQIQESRKKKSSIRQIGFIAQEVEELANRLNFEFSGVEKPENEQSMYRLRYAEFVVPLVKAVQEQQEVINKLTKRIDELEKQK